MRQALYAALDAELLLEICDAAKRVLEFAPMYYLIVQCMDVGLDSSDSRIKMV
jgi:hypothetical protein